jgi:hypothetical protein
MTRHEIGKFPPKRLYVLPRLYGVTFQKTGLPLVNTRESCLLCVDTRIAVETSCTAKNGARGLSLCSSTFREKVSLLFSFQLLCFFPCPRASHPLLVCPYSTSRKFRLELLDKEQNAAKIISLTRFLLETILVI